MTSPTSKNRRPWEFIVVTDDETKLRLSKATAFSSFAAGSPAVIVIIYDSGKNIRAAEDCSLSAGNIYLEAVNQGLGTCYVQIAGGTEAGSGDPEEFVRKTLGIPDRYRVQCIMPVGYPADLPGPHGDDEFDRGKIHLEVF